MRHAPTIAAAALVMISALPFAQADQGQPSSSSPTQNPNNVQVGVPEGRQGGGRQGGAGRGRRGGGPAAPAPRNAAGRVLLGGATPAEKGLWLPAGGVVLTPIAPDIPFQPWAAALYKDREGHRLEPHARCKASGVVRQFQTPYGIEFVELAELRRLYIFDVGGPHTFRTVYMDGRSHPDGLLPSYYGHSIGWWEGDTLVIDTTGFNEGFWLDRMGVPHTERLHTIERLTRINSAALQYEMTIDDPNVYTAPWKARFDMRWDQGTELFEYICQEANYAHDLMVGTLKSVDRAAPIIP